MNALDLLIIAFQTARDALEASNDDRAVNAFLDTLSDATDNSS